MVRPKETVVVAECEACGTVTTAIYAANEILNAPGCTGCPACPGSLEEMERLRDKPSFASDLTDGIPLRATLLQRLIEAEGEMSQGELITTVGRSPHFIRQAIQRLEDEGQITRDTDSGEWYVRLAFPDTETSDDVLPPEEGE